MVFDMFMLFQSYNILLFCLLLIYKYAVNFCIFTCTEILASSFLNSNDLSVYSFGFSTYIIILTMNNDKLSLYFYIDFDINLIPFYTSSLSLYLFVIATTFGTI